MKKSILATIAFSILAASSVFANDLVSTAPKNAQVYFISPQDGQVVDQNFKVTFGLSNMGVAPAGTNKKNTGHHHLLIDTELKSIDFSKSLPSTEKIKHFGGGQTETMLKLSPGKHTLRLLLGNYAHIPHETPVFSKQITVTVR